MLDSALAGDWAYAIPTIPEAIIRIANMVTRLLATVKNFMTSPHSRCFVKNPNMWFQCFPFCFPGMVSFEYLAVGFPRPPNSKPGDLQLASSCSWPEAEVPASIFQD
jgi:hypothetical protein